MDNPKLRKIHSFCRRFRIADRSGSCTAMAHGCSPFLTSVAAASLCLVMLFAIAEHIRHKEARDIPKNVIIMLLALFVATGRFNHLIVI